MKPKIKEVIVVEGKDDTKRIHLAVDADTIETNGSAIDKITLAAIAHAATKRGVIVFTDPDNQGERIRSIISQAVPKAKHAFLTREQAFLSRAVSLGIEHASVEDIQKALDQVYTLSGDSVATTYSVTELRELGLVGVKGSNQLREAVARHLNIGHVNGKQLAKRLAMFNITIEELLQAINDVLKESD